MKFFFWDDVLTDYTSGCMGAIAEDVESARAQLLKDCPYMPEGNLAKEPQVIECHTNFSFFCWGGG